MFTGQKVLAIHIKKDLLFTRRFGKDGMPIGEQTKWRVRKKTKTGERAKSQLPREMFFKIYGFLQQAIKKHGKESLDDITNAAREGLKQAGKAFSCDVEKGSTFADVYWFAQGKRLAAWQIHEEKLDNKRARKLRRSKALLRLVVLVKASGWFRIVPEVTRQRDP